MNREQLQKLFPRASEAFIAANCVASHANPERGPGNEPVAAAPRARVNPVRCIVRFTCHRCRMLDDENRYTKPFTDSLRYAGLIFDDSKDWCQVEVEQVKAEHWWEERTEITIEEI